MREERAAKGKTRGSQPKVVVYAVVWYHPAGKWKLDEAVIVEEGRRVGEASGGSFYFGSPRVKETVLKHALVEFLFYDPDKDERKLVKELERLKKEVRVEFVDDKTLEEIKKKYPEET
jgi:hypothetical protein